MLMLSKRPKETLSFPQAGITIHFLRVSSGMVKLGVDADPEIEIVQDGEQQASGEFGSSAAISQTGDAAPTLPREMRHGIRNELHGISVGMHLLREQLRMGLLDDADETFQMIKDSLKTLDESEILQSPDYA